MLNEKLKVTISINKSKIDKNYLIDLFLGISEHVFDESEKLLKIVYTYQKEGKTVRSENIDKTEFEVDKLSSLPDTRTIRVSFSMNKPINSIDVLATLTDEVKKIKEKLDKIGAVLKFNIGTTDMATMHAFFTFFISEDISFDIGNKYDDALEYNDKINVMTHFLNQNSKQGGFFIHGDYSNFLLLSNDTTLVLEKVEAYLEEFKKELSKIAEYEEKHDWKLGLSSPGSGQINKKLIYQHENAYMRDKHRYTKIAEFTLKEKADI